MSCYPDPRASRLAHFASDPDGRLQFETLISDTSAALMAASADGVDEEIQSALERTRAFFAADRCGLLTVSANQTSCTVYRASYAEGVSPVSGDLNLVELFPWAGTKLLSERVPVQFSRLADLPPEAAADCAVWTAMGVRSNLCVPIVTGAGRRVPDRVARRRRGARMARCVRAAPARAGRADGGRPPEADGVRGAAGRARSD